MLTFGKSGVRDHHIQIMPFSRPAVAVSIKHRNATQFCVDWPADGSAKGAAIMNSEILNSWKEIANYMNRGVRTVQRWETDLGLPVRRPPAGCKNAVIAFRSDIDRWLAQTPCKESDLPMTPLVSKELSALRARRKQMQERTRHIVELCSRTCELVRNAQELSLRIGKEKEERAAAA